MDDAYVHRACKITCRTYVLSGSAPSLARVRSREDKNSCISRRILGAIDLAIDFATLGEYGLEPLPASPVAGGVAHARRGECGRITTESRPVAALETKRR